VGQGINEPPNSQGCSQCGLLRTHTKGRSNIKVEINSHIWEYATVIRECGKERQRFTMEPRHEGQTPQSQQKHQMLVGDHEHTSTKRPRGCFHWKINWWVKGLMSHQILKVAANVYYYTCTQGEETVIKWNKIPVEVEMKLLLGNVVRKFKSSQGEPRHKSQTPQSRH
jgi:hypothetical protein